MADITGKKPSEFSSETINALKAVLNIPQVSDLMNNQVIYGVKPNVSETLTSNIDGGIAFINNKRVIVSETSHTYTALKRTYIDLSSEGVFTFIELTSEDDVPNVTADSIRIAWVNTSETAITSVKHISYTIAIGNLSQDTTKKSSLNVSLGWRALRLTESGNEFDDGAYNVAIGGEALSDNVIGHHNVAIGYGAAKNNKASYNVAIGEDALFSNKVGEWNVAVGHKAMYSGNGASKCVAIGRDALSAGCTGNWNVAVGNSAGKKSYDTSENVTSDSNLTLIGSLATVDRSIINQIFTNGTALGFGARVYKSNSVTIGNANVTNIYFGGYNGNATIKAKSAILTEVPTSADGLSAGEIWNNGGVLNIIS